MGFNCRFVVGKDRLTIDDVTEDDEGTYTCVTTTILDEDSASARLTVVGKYFFILSSFPENNLNKCVN